MQPNFVLRYAIFCSLLGEFGMALEQGNILSSNVYHDGDICLEKDGNCDNSNWQNKVSWKPFRLSQKDKWIAFDKLAEKYAKWHDEALLNEDFPCTKKKILVFTPNAGLGDSIGALTAAFTYAVRNGRLFFIDWKPFPWSLMFKDLPFFYDYRKALNSKSKSNQPLICPEEHDETSYLSGHITTQHPLAKEAKALDFNTDYSQMVTYFLQPSEEVQKVMNKILEGPFKDLDERNTLLHKVAIVMRTGIGEYNQFLSLGDEVNFVTCFRNYAQKFEETFKKGGSDKGSLLKFVVFVTSDNSKSKQNVVDALQNFRRENLDVGVVTLEDSAIHVMHMTPQDSEDVEVRTKLWKTIAEFFLIGKCDAKFLTHGSLFGRTAAEWGGGPEEMNFFLSDSNCDGKREKYSYLECHTPKYPSNCGLS